MTAGHRNNLDRNTRRVFDSVTHKGFALRVKYMWERENYNARKKAGNLNIISAVIVSRKLINKNGQSIPNGFYKYVIKDNTDTLLLGEKLSAPDINLSIKEARGLNVWPCTAHYKHSHIVTFEPVKYAGYIKIIDGKIDDIDLYSGHYALPKCLGYLLIDKFKHLFSNSFLKQLEDGESNLFLTQFYKDSFNKNGGDDQTDPYCETSELHSIDRELEFLNSLYLLSYDMKHILNKEAEYTKLLNKYNNTLKVSKSKGIGSNTAPPPQKLLDLKKEVDQFKQYHRQLKYYKEEFGNGDVNLDVIVEKINALSERRKALYDRLKDEFLLDSVK